MYRPYLLGIFAAIFFGYHILSGAWICYNEFCPGEHESDWVYEYTDDDDGKRYIMIDGNPILKDTYDKNLGIGKYNRDSK